jgi:hypothetical protein
MDGFHRYLAAKISPKKSVTSPEKNTKEKRRKE